MLTGDLITGITTTLTGDQVITMDTIIITITTAEDIITREEPETTATQDLL